MELLRPIHYEEYSDLQNMLDALDDEYSTNEESVIMSASVYFVILDAFWLISFIGGFVMIEWRCNGLIRIIFRGKSIVVIASLVVDITQRLLCHFLDSWEDMNMSMVRNVKHLIYPSNTKMIYSFFNLDFFYSTAKDFALLMDQGLSLIFFYFIYKCTCKMEVVENPQNGLGRAIMKTFLVLCMGSTVQFIATGFLPADFIWIHHLNGYIQPFGKILTTVITFSAVFWGVKILLALIKSRDFQRTHGSTVSNWNTSLISIVVTMLFTQSIRWVVQMVIVTYQFAGEDAYLSCTVEKDGNTVGEVNECFVDNFAESRILSVTITCPWYNLAEYVSILIPLLFTRFKNR